MSEQSQRKAPTLMFKRNEDALVPQPAPADPHSDLDTMLDIVTEAVGTALGETGNLQREEWQQDDAAIRLELGAVRQEIDRERALQARAANLERERHDLILREVADVRERTLRATEAVKAEVAEQTRELALTMREQNLVAGRALRADAEVRRELQDQRGEVTRRELAALREELALLTNAAALKEQAQEARRVLRAEAQAASDRIAQKSDELAKREIALLREEIGMENRLTELNAEITAAQVEVTAVKAGMPRLDEIEARIEERQSEIAAEQKRVESEVAKVKKRVGRLQVDAGLTAHRLSTFIDQQESAPTTTLEVVTSTTQFTLQDLPPAAALALQEFAAQALNAKDATPVWLRTPASERWLIGPTEEEIMQ